MGEKVHLKKKETFLEEMINEYETKFQQLSGKLQNFEKIMFINGCIKLRQSQQQDEKEDLYNNESQIENNQDFIKSEDHKSKQHLVENETILNENVETKTKEELQTYELKMEINDISFKLEKDENKNTLTNEIISQENQESVKLEEHEN